MSIGTSSRIKAGGVDQKGEKVPKIRQTGQRLATVPLFRSPTKTPELNNHRVHTEDIVLTHASV